MDIHIKTVKISSAYYNRRPEVFQKKKEKKTSNEKEINRNIKKGHHSLLYATGS